MISLLSAICLVFFQLSPSSSLQSWVEGFHKANSQSGFGVYVSVRSAKSNQEVVKYQPNQLVHPASTQKLLTTAVAMQTLPENFRFETSLSYDGTIADGQLNGNLYLHGNGDPLLGSARSGINYKTLITRWIEAIKKVGIRQINGQVIAVDALLESYDFPASWAWNDMGNYYGSVPYALNLNENMMEVAFEAGATVGSATTLLAVQPTSKFWEIKNLVTTGPRGSGDQVYIYSASTGNGIVMKGTVPLGATRFVVKGAIPKPAHLWVELLHDALKNENIICSNLPSVQATLPPASKPLYVSYSPSLDEMITACNFKSVNIIADGLLRAVGQQVRSDQNWEASVEVLKNQLELAGLSAKRMQLKDGSGLSPQGLLTPAFYTHQLSHLAKQTYFKRYLNTIPVVGVSGTVSHLAKGTKTAGRVWAKSGSMEGVRTYSGYFNTKSNETMCFFVAINHYAPDDQPIVRKFMEDFLIKLGDFK